MGTWSWKVWREVGHAEVGHGQLVGVLVGNLLDLFVFVLFVVLTGAIGAKKGGLGVKFRVS